MIYTKEYIKTHKNNYALKVFLKDIYVFLFMYYTTCASPEDNLLKRLKHVNPLNTNTLRYMQCYNFLTLSLV